MADLTGPNPDEVGGDVAHDATDSGMPVKMGGYASAAAPSAVSGDGDRVNLWLSRFGAANVILRDTSGAAIATGTQYTENAVITADAGVGTLVVGRRDDALTTLTPAENDAVGLRVGDKGALWVQIADGSGAQVTSFGGGTQYVEDVAMGATPTGTLAVGVGSTALPSAVSADGDAVGLWATLNGALNVVLRSAAGTAVDTTGDILGVRIDNASDPVLLSGGSTAHDDPATTVDPLLMGAYASAAAPTSVSTDTDAVRLWALRNGSLVVNLASGGTLLTIGQKTAANSFPVVLPSDGYGSGATAAMHVVLGTGAADYTLFGQAAASAPFTRLTDATTTVGVIAGTTALKTDTSSIAGTAAVTSGVNGLLGVGGGLAHDTAAAAMYPVGTGAFASVAAPADVSADGDVVKLWALRNGSQVVNLAAGGTLWTNMGQTGATGQFVRINDGTTTAGVIVGTTALKTDLSSIAGTAPGATAFVPSRLTDGTAYYTKTGQTAATAAFAQLSDQTTAVNVIAATNALKTDLSSVAGTATVTGGVAGSQGVGGLAAHAAAASGNPVFIGGRASAVIPTDVGADGDVAAMWTNRNGAQVITAAPHVGLNGDPWSLVHEAAQYTSTQTSTVLVAGAGGEKIVVTKVQIQAFGTTAFDLQLYFGTAAFARGTNRAVYDGRFVPTATFAPGVVMDGPFIAGANGDDLMVTTSAAGSVTINVWYYVVT